MIIPSYITAFLEAALKDAPRDILHFAEEEIILPEGPREDQRFRFDYAPFTRLVLREIENREGKWQIVAITGSVQSGKTTIAQVIPAVYDLFERKCDLGLAGPTIDDAQEIWEKKIRPMIDRTKYKNRLPSIGRGSKGGRARNVRLDRGNWLRFFGSGTGYSYTVRRMIITEVDRIDDPGTSSRETDPIRQLVSRTHAFGDKGFAVLECTVTTPDGRIWREITEYGSDGRVYIRCPHCMDYIFPERANFVGWEAGENEIEAGNLARYVCQTCGVLWDEDDRLAANRHPVIVHATEPPPKNDQAGRKYQRVINESDWSAFLSAAAAGDADAARIIRESREADNGLCHIFGPDPSTWTRTCGIRWNWMHVPREMVSMAQIGREEWKSANRLADDRDKTNIEKELCQHRWAIPFEEETVARKLSVRFVNSHAAEYVKSSVPEGVLFTIGGVDIQKEWLYWIVYGYNLNMTRWLIDYGVVQFLPEGHAGIDPSETQVRLGMASMAQLVESYNCVHCAVDVGYKHKGGYRGPVRQWLLEKKGIFRAVVGRSRGQMTKMQNIGRKLDLPVELADLIIARRQNMGDVIYFLSVENLKADFHDSFFIPQGEPGCIYLFKDIKDYGSYSRHVIGEHQETIFEAGRGYMTRWMTTSRRHDLLDASGYCEAFARLRAMQEKARIEAEKKSEKSYPAAKPHYDVQKKGWKIGR